ncbi:MAG: putative sporulation protein YtxC [Firmicutes bacterium]|nr:putative sporulation protein YtxC [Bacillota bacterium]
MRNSRRKTPEGGQEAATRLTPSRLRLGRGMRGHYVQFLRCYSAWHQSPHLQVHVTYDNPCVIKNEEDEEGTSMIAEKLCADSVSTQISSPEDYDDFIVMNLVETSPEQIVLHGDFPRSLIRRLSEIFPGRVMRESGVLKPYCSSRVQGIDRLGTFL